MPPTPPPPPWRLTARAVLLGALRQFFANANFCEVDTPILVRAPAQEHGIEAVPVAICTADFDLTRPSSRFLQTSPELCMKRLVALGLPRIYQVAPAFRDGDGSRIHNPEFRLLEWYRAHAPWTHLMTDCEDLIAFLASRAQDLMPKSVQATLEAPPWAFARPYRRITVQAAFLEHAGLDILATSEVAPLQTALAARGILFDPQDTWDDLFHRLFLTLVEPALVAPGTPFFLTHFPVAQAALAQVCPHDPRVAERFELYVGGMELANAFGELTCPREQRRRFEATKAERVAAGRRAYPLDEAFLSALEHMPPTSGIALGLERLLMVLLHADHIDDVSFIPFRDA